ncbi:hypothetical protein PVOR_22979 [Paenibacillus vortex V453]|uniref:Uncharacterized protein n=2 Tax=Paenibacillus TaxID=44249 RepID=A0A163EFQ3_9BACL|nr:MULTISPECIES: hypothetical protein [Paenibacillus]AWP26860.1 hypothetical protein B9D94_09610 [Paenibacillus sp. Cedars]EFU40167.1 hypothetical protein PVOR_22979 [Paenibacillus vortex V453]KZS43785.1 hypothetical protein AWU65_27255 [Paenibacillus glucanolyticus]MDH6669559.1 hypothetical protein [Paenibacillus sp. LBL]OMF83180.1 hypothetical protein BK142_00590 [Paenibacillus glucanolyticus]
MRYVDWLQGFIGSETEVTVSGDVIIGTLTEVGEGTISLKIPPIIYGPPTDTAIIPLRAIEFVRIVSS